MWCHVEQIDPGAYLPRVVFNNLGVGKPMYLPRVVFNNLGVGKPIPVRQGLLVLRRWMPPYVGINRLAQLQQVIGAGVHCDYLLSRRLPLGPVRPKRKPKHAQQGIDLPAYPMPQQGAQPRRSPRLG